MSDMGGLNAPTDRRVVIVSASGASVSLRLRKRESYSAKRNVSQGTLETGYKISDGTIKEQPTIEIEGIVTGSDGYALAFDPSRINAEVASINNVFKLDELVSIYASFIVVSDAVLTEFNAEATPKDKTITIKLGAKKVKFVTFQRTQNDAPAPKATKTKNPAGQGRADTGKKSATPKDKPKQDILYFS